MDRAEDAKKLLEVTVSMAAIDSLLGNDIKPSPGEEGTVSCHTPYTRLI